MKRLTVLLLATAAAGVLTAAPAAACAGEGCPPHCVVFEMLGRPICR